MVFEATIVSLSSLLCDVTLSLKGGLLYVLNLVDAFLYKFLHVYEIYDVFYQLLKNIPTGLINCPIQVFCYA